MCQKQLSRKKKIKYTFKNQQIIYSVFRSNEKVKPDLKIGLKEATGQNVKANRRLQRKQSLLLLRLIGAVGVQQSRHKTKEEKKKKYETVQQ